MKKTSKITTWVLAVSMAALLTACGSSGQG